MCAPFYPIRTGHAVDGISTRHATRLRESGIAGIRQTRACPRRILGPAGLRRTCNARAFACDIQNFVPICHVHAHFLRHSGGGPPSPVHVYSLFDCPFCSAMSNTNIIFAVWTTGTMRQVFTLSRIRRRSGGFLASSQSPCYQGLFCPTLL